MVPFQSEFLMHLIQASDLQAMGVDAIVSLKPWFLSREDVKSASQKIREQGKSVLAKVGQAVFVPAGAVPLVTVVANEGDEDPSPGSCLVFPLVHKGLKPKGDKTPTADYITKLFEATRSRKTWPQYRTQVLALIGGW